MDVDEVVVVLDRLRVGVEDALDVVLTDVVAALEEDLALDVATEVEDVLTSDVAGPLADLT